MENSTQQRTAAGLCDSRYDRDSCGIGAIVDIKGIPTHKIVDDALTIVEHLEHRAGVDADGQTGDGVGILLQISHRFFMSVCPSLGISLDNARDYGVGMIFFPRKAETRAQSMRMLESIAKKEGLEFLGWRSVPVHPEILSEKARDCMPVILQCFLRRPADVPQGLAFDRRLYIVRRIFEQTCRDTYVCSLSSRTIVYKGMFLVPQLRKFYDDLQSPDYCSAIALVHSRFSTNTTPSWNRAHPNRYILHNGEINTIRGNVDLMQAREESIHSPCMQEDMMKVLPIIDPDGSDSAMLDNALEFMMMNGMPLPLAVMVTIPEPWEKNPNLSRELRSFYQYYAPMLEPWDGPASIVFSDGDVMGAVLDRNGLRPSRYYITKENYLILSSEVGVLDIPANRIVKKDRLRPGKMLLVDTVQRRVIDDRELKETYARRRPYGEWVDRNLLCLKTLRVPNEMVPRFCREDLLQRQILFGYTQEGIDQQIAPMALHGVEPTVAMGVDSCQAVLSDKPFPLFSFFKQRFAQVTNPPIDALRESIVTSTTMYLGARGNFLEDNPDNCRVLKLDRPILSDTEMLSIKHLDRPGLKVAVLPTTYYRGRKLTDVLDRLCLQADRAYQDGSTILVLSDRDVDESKSYIPILLAVSAVSHYLVRTRKRTGVALVAETGEASEVHHFATLLGYGACAVNPYLAHATIRDQVENGRLSKDYYAAASDYDRAAVNGLLRIASKMGISTLQSYHGSQIFESVGLSQELVDRHFTGTINRVGGITLDDIQADTERNHQRAFPAASAEPQASSPEPQLRGTYVERDDHLYRPETISRLQKSIFTNNYKLFKEYAEIVNNSCTHLRSLLDFRYPESGIPLEKVEPAESIIHHFKISSMSYGALSKEAHEAIAIAANRMGCLSGSGEGGEPEERYRSGETGPDRNSGVKQIASGRFGVTESYLLSAKEIEIKMAQGAKPGEGGQLPGSKVYPWIAATRHSTTGVSLISPPPHHDIYSIEDLAQLIYDLKNANRDASITVKLCSEAGVGTIASGVAKAGAQGVLICGYDGGTGSAPRNSVANAGLPWELGVAETHQALIMNNLRRRVRLGTDGKLLTGREIAMAALLGAEEFGFGSSVLVSLGCIMMRVCDKDSCPVGVCTQNPALRAKFRGKPEYVETLFRFLAEDLREIMARLGIARLDDMVGRTELLQIKTLDPDTKASKLNFDRLLHNPQVSNSHIHFDPTDEADIGLKNTLDRKVLQPAFLKKLEKGEPSEISLSVSNVNRTFGTILGSEITRRYGNNLPAGTYKVHCRGAGGQSFGAFIPKGLTLSLEGDCNDYLGKGHSGGTLVVYPPENSEFSREENVIIGNVALYGATSGKAFISGVAGERFAVRNSGAQAVVEGVGDHGCEYMTGGVVVVLGKTGRNFAAGMSGGLAYVLDEDWSFYQRLNHDMVDLEPVEDKSDVLKLRQLIRDHVEATGSPLGRKILEDFNEYLPKFKKVIPRDYQAILQRIADLEGKGFDSQQAQMEAFMMLRSETVPQKASGAKKKPVIVAVKSPAPAPASRKKSDSGQIKSISVEHTRKVSG